MNGFRDLYDVLALDRYASPSEVREVYRNMCLLHHPDSFPSYERQFGSIQHTYEILRSSNMKAAYDVQLHEQELAYQNFSLQYQEKLNRQREGLKREKENLAKQKAEFEKQKQNFEFSKSEYGQQNSNDSRSLNYSYNNKFSSHSSESDAEYEGGFSSIAGGQNRS